MQHDEVIWQLVGHNFCSFKVKMETQNFCRNTYNVTGLCNRSSCPLANSRYATVIEDEGKIYLYIKTIERAHTPNRLWQKVKLSANYASALAQVDEHLQYFPKFQVHKCKQRMTKITQYLIRMRRLQMKVRPKLVGVAKKVERRERNRERKAEVAARLEKVIEKELLQRLQKGTYEDIYNFPMQNYEKALDDEQLEVEADVSGSEEEEEDAGGARGPAFVADDEEGFDDFDDMEDFGAGGEFAASDTSSGSDVSDDDDEDGDGGDSSEGEEGGASSAAAAAEQATMAGKTAAKAKLRARPKRARRGRVELEIEHEEEELPGETNLDY